MIGRRLGLGQSDRHQGKSDDNGNDAEGIESRWASRWEKELSDDPGQQPRHGVDAQDLSPGLISRGTVEPALDNDEKPSKTKARQSASHNPND